ncbi:DUF6088 family protein [Mesorhizobium sp. M7A.F.Ca.US.010.02.1.1]|uniref:DUF6088 family protein n=1 Tax=Mesorhizobium sp. M7A.F.Ca.US.010.02.1.1 TaxID=2496743 RepID=UPI001FE177C8|nr:DUF6088 family protein [Mesorhizobium sp. M7A.F.Ca.US.010.02.1.1]
MRYQSFDEDVELVASKPGCQSEICGHFSDKSEIRSDLKALIEDRMVASPPRTAWTPADFLDLGNRDAVDKVLQRTVKAAELRRIDRGLYDRPTFNTLTQQKSPPDPRRVIDAVARRDQIRVLVDGMTAANDLGLTNAVPARIVVHADARLRPIRLGNLDITFRPTSASKLYWAGRPAMRVVQALHWMRDMLGQDDGNQKLLRRLRRLLNDSDQGERLRADLAEGLPTLPAWMQVLLKSLLKDAAEISQAQLQPNGTTPPRMPSQSILPMTKF